MALTDSVHDAAREYIRRGWQVVRILPGTKKCVEAGWQNSHLVEADVPTYFYDGAGIGVVLGDPSGGLADVDLDVPEAIQLAGVFLPETDLVHGHRSKAASHHYYTAHGVETKRFKDTDRTNLVEVRGTGCYTVWPPTPHESGEAILWSRYGTPAVADASGLSTRVGWLAACVLFARHWAGEGSRHELALAAGGYLLRRGVPVEWAVRIVGNAARLGGDADWRDRERDVTDTAAAQERGEPVTGGPTVASLVGDDVVTRLQDWLGNPDAGEGAPDATERIVDVTVQNLPEQTRQAWDAVQAANLPPRIFVVGGVVSRIVGSLHEGIALRNVSPDELRHEAARAGRFVRWVEQQRRDVYPPMGMIKDMLADSAPPLPVVNRIVKAPTFTSDGEVVWEAGYHAASGIYYAPADGFHVPEVPDAPGPDDIARARSLILDEELGDFPFDSDADQAHAVALLVETLVRPLIGGTTPLYVVNKPSPGTGASLLIEMLLHVALGGPAPTVSETRDEEEWRKRITALLSSGTSVVVIDNVKRRLSSAALSAAITTGRWQDRILGETRTVQFDVTCSWVANGNNISLSMDLARRSVHIRLDARRDRPWERTGFKHPDLRDWVRQHRGELVWAVLVLVKAWLAAGSPAGTRTLGGFEAWSKTIGGILEVAGIKGFLGNLADFYDEVDAESADWRILVLRWWQRWHDEEVTAGDLWQLVEPTLAEQDPLDLGLGEGSERALKTRFGRRLAQMRDRQFGDHRVTRVDRQRHNAQLWRLVLVSPDPPSGTSPDVPPEPPPCNSACDEGLATDGEGGERGIPFPKEPLSVKEERSTRGTDGGDEPPHPPDVTPLDPNASPEELDAWFAQFGPPPGGH